VPPGPSVSRARTFRTRTRLAPAPAWPGSDTFTSPWEAPMPTPGASDAAGNVQPDVPPWDGLGYGENAIEVLFVDRH